MVERAGLENRNTRKRIVGSNPTLSARKQKRPDYGAFLFSVVWGVWTNPLVRKRARRVSVQTNAPWARYVGTTTEHPVNVRLDAGSFLDPAVPSRSVAKDDRLKAISSHWLRPLKLNLQAS